MPDQDVTLNVPDTTNAKILWLVLASSAKIPAENLTQMFVAVEPTVKSRTTNQFAHAQEVTLEIHLSRVANLPNKICVILTLVETVPLVNPEMTGQAVTDLFVLALKAIEEIL